MTALLHPRDFLLHCHDRRSPPLLYHGLHSPLLCHGRSGSVTDDLKIPEPSPTVINRLNSVSSYRRPVKIHPHACGVFWVVWVKVDTKFLSSPSRDTNAA